jgi:hypothetical protein
MGVFASSSSINEGYDESSLLEDYNAYEADVAAAYLAQHDDETIQTFLASEECEMLIQEGKISRKTIMKLNKNDDLTRRKKQAAYQLAREHNDPLWTKLVKNRVKERELINAIMAKYGNKGEMVAKKSQRAFIAGKSPSAHVKSAIDKSRQKELAAGKAGRL